MNKTTDELLSELNSSKCNIDDFLEHNKSSIVEINLANFWKELVGKSGMTKSDIINKSDFSYVYFYDVINGRKTPSADKIIRLILTMKLSVEDCQKALKYCGNSTLYARFKRDAIIISGINQGKSIEEVSELLKANGEEELK